MPIPHQTLIQLHYMQQVREVAAGFNQFLYQIITMLLYPKKMFGLVPLQLVLHHLWLIMMVLRIIIYVTAKVTLQVWLFNHLAVM